MVDFDRSQLLVVGGNLFKVQVEVIGNKKHIKDLLSKEPLVSELKKNITTVLHTKCMQPIRTERIVVYPRNAGRWAGEKQYNFYKQGKPLKVSQMVHTLNVRLLPPIDANPPRREAARLPHQSVENAEEKVRRWSDARRILEEMQTPEHIQHFKSRKRKRLVNPPQADVQTQSNAFSPRRTRSGRQLKALSNKRKATVEVDEVDSNPAVEARSLGHHKTQIKQPKPTLMRPGKRRLVGGRTNKSSLDAHRESINPEPVSGRRKTNSKRSQRRGRSKSKESTRAVSTEATPTKSIMESIIGLPGSAVKGLMSMFSQGRNSE